jgi:hypothetical protein
MERILSMEIWAARRIRARFFVSLAAAFASILVSLAVLGTPAHADADVDDVPASCTGALDSADIDTTVSRLIVTLHHCTAPGSMWRELRGTVYDNSCDARRAFVYLYKDGGSKREFWANGCGNYTPFQVVYAGPGRLYKVETSACGNWIQGCYTPWGMKTLLPIGYF